MTLIANWRQAWRFFSIQAQTLALAMIGAWQMLPDRMQAAVVQAAGRGSRQHGTAAAAGGCLGAPSGA